MIVRNISYRNILSDISLEIKAGQICCVLGENGSGKSSLIKNLAGFYKADHGAIMINNIQIQALKVQQLYEYRAVLTQHNFVANDILCKDYIELAVYNATNLSKKSELLAHLAKALSLEDLLEKNYTLCSGGEQQKVNLARVFLQALINYDASKTFYMLLDEPFNSLDIKHIPLACNYIKYLKELNFGIMIILHDINLAHKICDEILFLKQGKVVDFGTKELVFNLNNLNLTFDLPFEEFLTPHGEKYYTS